MLLSVKSPEDDLSRRLVVLLCQWQNCRLLQQDGFIWMFPGSVWRPQGAVGGHHQTPVPTVCQQVYLGQVRVALYLPDRCTEAPSAGCSPSLTLWSEATYLKNGGLNAGHRQDVVNLPAVEVGQADGSDQALLHQLLHGCPGHLVVCVIVQQGAILLPGERSISSSDTWKRETGVSAAHSLTPNLTVSMPPFLYDHWTKALVQ